MSLNPTGTNFGQPTTSTHLRQSSIQNDESNEASCRQQLTIAYIVGTCLMYALGAFGTICSANCGIVSDSSPCPPICQNMVLNIIFIIFGIGGILGTLFQRDIRGWIAKQ